MEQIKRLSPPAKELNAPRTATRKGPACCGPQGPNPLSIKPANARQMPPTVPHALILAIFFIFILIPAGHDCKEYIEPHALSPFVPQKASVLRTCRRTLRQPSPRTAFTTEKESRLILAIRPRHFSNVSRAICLSTNPVTSPGRLH